MKSSPGNEMSDMFMESILDLVGSGSKGKDKYDMAQFFESLRGMGDLRGTMNHLLEACLRLGSVLTPFREQKAYAGTDDAMDTNDDEFDMYSDVGEYE